MGRKLKHKSKSNLTSRNSTCKNNVVKNHPLMTDLKANNDNSILITDRLSLMPYHSDEGENDESELQLDFRPRAYYVNTLCLECSKFCDNRQFECTDCRMIVYCSAEHRQQSSKKHKQLCAILVDVCLKNSALSLAKDMNADDYRKFRVQLLQMIENALGRRMELWEREILLYPRLCRVCHGSEDLKECSDCHMEYFCTNENEKHRGNHADHCAEFKVFRTILSLQKENGFVAPKIPSFTYNDDDKFPESFDHLIQYIYQFGCDYEKIDCVSYAALSQTSTPALTAIYAIQQLKQNMNRKLLKIHVIGAELQFECANVTAWEKFFLHFLPDVKSLRLEFSGPELQVPSDIASLLERPKLCSRCRAKNRKINIIFHCGQLYHEVENDKPDLVCLFNPGLYRTTAYANQDSWPKTIEKFCDYGVPILVTSYTEVELPLDLARMRQYREVQIEQEPRRNPFASLKPERNFVSDDATPLIYKNYFLSVARGIPGSRGCSDAPCK